MYDGSAQQVSFAHKFTGKERDSESGLDNFGARYDSSSLGRFMSADPGNISGILNQDDPQSWNGYAYVRNNPLNITDPDGENYSVCDSNGKNCADLTDKEYEQFRNDNPNLRVTPSGDIYTINQNGTETKTGSASYYNEHALDDLINAGNMAAPGVNLAANGLRAFGYAVAAPLMVTAECLAGAPSCTKGNVAMAILPEVGAPGVAPLSKGERVMLDRKKLDTFYRELQTPSRREANTPTPQVEQTEEDSKSELTQS